MVDTVKDDPKLVRIDEQQDGGAVVFDLEPGPTPNSEGEGAAPAPAAATTDHDDDDPDTPTRPATEAEELEAAATDADREQIRARRRLERQQKRERRRTQNEDLRRELSIRDQQIQQLAGVVNVLQRRSSGTELAQLDAEIAGADEALANLRGTIAEATKQGNGDIVADATERMMQVHTRSNDLKRVRTNFVQNSQRTAQQTATSAQPTAPAINPRVRELGTAWASKNSWYQAQGQDLDSRITRQIDDTLVQEGYDPASQDYWEELTSRVGQYLPHRTQTERREGNGNGDYNAARNGRKPGSSAVTGSGREGAASSGSGNKSGYVLSPARVQALKDAGVWDDPSKRTDAIRRYRDYDNQQSRQSR